MRNSYIIGIVFLLLILLTCGQAPVASEGEIVAIGRVKYIHLEGGFYGIITEDGVKVLPLNLPSEFKRDGLKIWFRARPREVSTTYMWGEPVEILEIKLIENIREHPKVRVAILYERITDGIYHPSKMRTYQDLVRILREIRPELVFRVWWRWDPVPETLPSDTSIYQAGHTYQQLEETLRKLRRDLPEVKYWFGSIPTQRINLEERDPITGKVYSRQETWQMALDPRKWGINFSKERFQELAQSRGTGRYGYFPDITNGEFQELYLSWGKRQIDAGVNGLFLDMLFAQPRFLAKITGDPNHRAVRESLKAIDYLIERIRDYGYKRGRYIYICSWWTFTDFPNYTPDLDFVLISPTVEEIRELALDERRWDEIISKVKQRLPEAGILAMIDWAGTTNTPLGVFSQELSKEEQREFLRVADKFFSERGIVFIYPVHGGFMGQDAKILSFGSLKTYDSLAPEFDTYETIKDLAQDKHKSKKVTVSANEAVKYLALGAGSYGNVAGRGERSLLFNLLEEFKRDGSGVWFKATPEEVTTIQICGKTDRSLEVIKLIKKMKNKIKVAIVYERIGDGNWINRSVEDEIKIFKETKADFIFRAFWRWSPCPERCEDFPENHRKRCELRGYSYEHLEKTILKIKSEIPEVIICGAIPAQIISRRAVWNPKTKETIRFPETWNMALDPQKWGINISKEEFQCRFAKTHFWVPQDLDCSDYSPEIASAYFPDITNEKFQELLLSWAERQIDAGVDAIWIDMLFKQAVMFYHLTGDFDHPAVKDSYSAINKIVEKIHEYGRDNGKYIYVGSWATSIKFPYLPPQLDFVTLSPSNREVREMRFDEGKWDEYLSQIREKLGDIPIFTFLDWAGTTGTPLGVFSQRLSREEQREFLKKADEFFSEKGVIFVYPVHGGWMGNDAQILSFGKSRVYDSLAPEFDTYETIKELTQSKKNTHDSFKEKLLSTDVACWYQSITDYKAFNRTIDDVITHLKEIDVDFIFRAFWKYKVIPETCSELPIHQRKRCEKAGCSYENFKKSINAIKEEIPSIIISAGIPTERIDANEYNPMTGRKYTRNELWEMALDPQKWGIVNPKTGQPITKEQFQFNRGKLLGFLPADWNSPSDYDWREAYAYYPDITDPEFQELQLSWAEKMIDFGADAIWIDMLFAQARLFYELTEDPYHPAVREAYESALRQVDRIHQYARRRGKHVYVGGWTNFLEIKDSEGKPVYPMPDFDFVVNMIWEREVENRSLSEERWDAFFTKVKKYLGDDVLILIFMDEAAVRWQDQPLGIFSQYLDRAEQAEFLKMADAFFTRKRREFKLPITFVYPLHGGWMGSNAEILSFGKFKVYDSLAPEFDTYETIRELAQEKMGR